MAAGKEREWTAIYQTPSPMDADLVRTTLEVADDAREFLTQKTSLMTDDATPERPDDNTSLPAASLADVGQEILELRRQHVVAACKYCGISTLDVGEMELDSRMIALLRVAGSASTPPLSASSIRESESARTAPVTRLSANCAAGCSTRSSTKASIAGRRATRPTFAAVAAAASKTRFRRIGTGDRG